jgi:hypothetical protein
LVARLEAVDASAESFVTLIKRAVRAGNKELALLVLQRGREKASPGEQALLTHAARELGLEQAVASASPRADSRFARTVWISVCLRHPCMTSGVDPGYRARVKAGPPARQAWFPRPAATRHGDIAAVTWGEHASREPNEQVSWIGL